jgi:hypothetical protein
MAQTSRFWTTDGNGDGATAYTMAEIAEVFRTAFTSDNYATQGVLKGYLNGLAVSGTASPISVATGAAMVYGFFYTNDAALDVAVATPISGTTGHRLVLRASWSTTQTVRVYDIASADGTATIPAVTQTPGTTYDITLATFTITTGGVIAVADARSYCAYPSYWTTSDMQTDSVDDTVAGNRVVRLDRRQGGDATAWDEVGTTDYTPTMVRMQCGSISASVNADNGAITVTFPTAFSDHPAVFCSYSGTDVATIELSCGIGTTNATAASIRWKTTATITQTITFSWIAVGPE